jgi:hypothetical protein
VEAQTKLCLVLRGFSQRSLIQCVAASAGMKCRELVKASLFQFMLCASFSMEFFQEANWQATGAKHQEKRRRPVDSRSYIFSEIKKAESPLPSTSIHLYFLQKLTAKFFFKLFI